MKHELKITVSGPAGSGKSALAQLIADTLLKCGFADTVLVEPDHPRRSQEAQHDMLKKLMDKTSVVVLSEQLRRSSGKL